MQDEERGRAMVKQALLHALEKRHKSTSVGVTARQYCSGPMFAFLAAYFKTMIVSIGDMTCEDAGPRLETRDRLGDTRKASG